MAPYSSKTKISEKKRKHTLTHWFQPIATTEDDNNFRRQIQDDFEKKCPKLSYGGQKHLQSFSKRTSNEKSFVLK